MLENGRLRAQLSKERESETVPDFFPVVKVFTPDAKCVWLLTALDPDEPDLAFGLCDLGMGYPELAYVRLSELEAVRGPRGSRVKRDPYFRPKHPISKYAEDASKHGRIRH